MQTVIAKSKPSHVLTDMSIVKSDGNGTALYAMQVNGSNWVAGYSADDMIAYLFNKLRGV